MSLGDTTSNVSDGTLSTAQSALTANTAALGQTATASTNFANQFYQQYIQPAIGQVTSAVDNSMAQNQATYNTAAAQTAQATQLATGTGIPLIQNYANQVQNFSSQQYADQQATLGIGDVAQQQQTQQQATARSNNAVGVNPSSGAALSLQNQNNVTYATAKAAAAAQARALANQQALSVGSSGANLGVQLQAQPGAALATQSSITGQGAAIPAQDLGAIAGATSAVYPGYQTAASAQGSIESAQGGVTSNANKSAQDAQDADDAGIGSIIGTVGAAAIKAAPLLMA